MSLAYHRPYFTVEEYFAMDDSSIRHEFYYGEIFAMAGGSINHNRITGNINAAINSNTKKCESFSSNLRVETDTDQAYCYPDVVVICNDIKTSKRWKDTVTNPICIFEVLSPSTEKYDRKDKLDMYKRIITLQHSFIVSQNRIFIEHHYFENNEWRVKMYKNENDIIKVEDFELSLSDIYKRVTFD